MPYSSITLPIGYLLCDGSEVSRTEYSTLFEIIGTSYGEGDGTNTFNLPNIKGKVAIGLDSEDEDFSVLGKTGGEKEHKLTVDEMPKHRHTVSLLSSGSGTYKNLYSGIDGTPYATSSSYAGGDIPHNNLQPYTVVNYIIKASGTAVLNGNVVDNLTDNSTENAPSQRAVNNAINNVNGTILWTNPNPSSSFASQSITLNETIDNYDAYCVIYRANYSSDLLQNSGQLPISPARMLTGVSGYFIWRDVTTISGTTVTFGTGNREGSNTNDGWIIPIYIIGYKTGLFS